MPITKSGFNHTVFGSHESRGYGTVVRGRTITITAMIFQLHNMTAILHLAATTEHCPPFITKNVHFSGEKALLLFSDASLTFKFRIAEMRTAILNLMDEKCCLA